MNSAVRAEIITVGTELTTGQSLDTNSQWLSQRLGEIGIIPAFHTTVADELADLTAAVRLASSRAAVVLLTGGLGPTQDDLTRDALAAAAGEPLVEDAAALEQIREMFVRRGRPMPDRNRQQALRPRNAETIPNPIGTAPGIWMRLGAAVVAALPGVPSEMRRMYDEQIRPRLLAMGLAGGQVIRIHTIHTFGWGESAVEERLLDLTARGHVPEVGITVSDAVVTLRIIARAATPDEADEQVRRVETVIRQRLGDLVFGTGDEELEDVVVRLLQEKRQTLATAESITGGGVAHRICRVPGASNSFRGGIVAYTDAAKHQLLGVPQDILEQHGAVSELVARAMANGARERFGVDLAVATTGFAGPTGGTPSEPIGTVYVAVAHAAGTEVLRTVWGGERTEVMNRTARLALNQVRLYLLRL